jgi:hypothetical protein
VTSDQHTRLPDFCTVGNVRSILVKDPHIRVFHVNISMEKYLSEMVEKISWK